MQSNKKLYLILSGIAAVILIAIFSIVALAAGIYFLTDKPRPFHGKPTPTPAEKPTVNKLSSNNPPTFKNSIGMEFVIIPSGSFTMGSPSTEEKRSNDESPQHKVTINYEFYLGKFEVTQEEYNKVMGTNPSHFKNCPRCPVEQVSWNDAQEFIKKLNAKNDGYEYRLPSEAEWEYAARAGTTTAFAFGNSLISEQANFDGNYPYKSFEKGKNLGKTANVGSYQPNNWGLYDMHGNVFEWVADIYKENYDGLPADGSANTSVGEADFQVLRGGAWWNFGDGCRSGPRFKTKPLRRHPVNGFRVASRRK